MSITISEEDPQMVIIPKIILHIDNCFCTIECVFKTGQDTQLKAIKKLSKEIKQLRITGNDFTNRCFQLIFTPEKNKLLLQSFDYTLHRRKKSLSPVLYTAYHGFSCSTSPLSSLISFIFLSRPLDDSILCTLLVLKTFEKNKKVLKYTLS